MAVTQIADVIVPTIFQNYITENRLVSTALFQSGVAVQNGEMAAQLSAAAQSFTVPCWNDLIETQVHIGSDAEEPNPEGGGGFNPPQKAKRIHAGFSPGGMLFTD